jgi:ABC-type Zn uptake system ZnuABC Zn-binding protein ZnuA/ABC-type Mn2+/Zn2+ transport system permease subunit
MIIVSQVLNPFHYAFVQRGLLEVLLLSVGAGLLGTWVVLRGLAFYSHAVATAAFPGLVLADGLAFAAPLGALGAALAFAAVVVGLARGRRSGYDTLTALALVGALALGVILASDVFHSGANVESLLFGSLLLVGRSDLWIAGGVSAAVLVAGRILGRRWLAAGFDPGFARAAGARSGLPDVTLLVLIALGVVAALTAVGALLVTALVVVPAATVRLVTARLPGWQLGAVALTAAEGAIGLWISVQANVPPGAAIAVLGGCVFAAVAVWRALRPRLLVLAPAAALLLVCAGCGSSGSSSGRLEVVATTTQIGDFARQVGGSDAWVHQILRANTDPHEYEPRPADVVTTAGARVVLENGDGLDAWMGKVVSESGGSPRVVVLGDHVPVHIRGETSGPHPSRFDPHWWHDPRNAEAAVVVTRDAFVRSDPQHASAYRRRAAAYLAQLRRLDRGIASCVSSIPRADRKLVTNHDAFNYFVRRYGIRFVGAVIPSQTTQAQASAGQTAALIRLIRREHVKAVFPESSVNARLAQTIARETGARSGYTLYGDTLGPAGSPGATYLAMERANADALVRGLTGSAHGCRIGGLR